MTSEPSIEEIQQENGKVESFRDETIRDRICEEVNSSEVLQVFDKALQEYYISTNTYTIKRFIGYKNPM